MYFQMKYFTAFQISHFDGYLRQGLLPDLYTLGISVLQAYKPLFFMLAAGASLVALNADRRSFLFHLNSIFILITTAVVLLKLTGIYPVIHARHIIWLLPFNIVILLLCLNTSVISLADTRKQLFKIIVAVLVTLQFISMGAGYTYYSFFNTRSDNTALFTALAELPTAYVVTYTGASPPLEYYMKLIPELAKHRYSGQWVMDSVLNYTGPTIPEIIASSLNPPPAREFYYVISHLDFHNPAALSDKHSARRASIIASFKKNSCNYTAVFEARNATILSVKCNNGV